MPNENSREAKGILDETHGITTSNNSLGQVAGGIRRSNRQKIPIENTRRNGLYRGESSYLFCQFSHQQTGPQTDLKRLIELMEKRHVEYTTDRTIDSERMDRLESTVGNLQLRATKPDLPPTPPFQVMQWIFKAEQFFDYYSTPDLQRLTIATVHLDKGVVPWFQMTNRISPFTSWAAFRAALEAEFGPSPYECRHANLFKLTQSSSVSEFYSDFTALANRIEEISTATLLDCFLSGLKSDIRRDVVA
ncbi:hypothetical protein OSB04_030113 [Centaurea solstitialis]|uniref:Retrotransposon gag domain-containing protein n=1 Tax=Centaurea solstitialis TaxID=347529 RepID=A0AA38W3I1_9ASTR|nr:hypothetical protein OSB04_030113 [Centaurea solstitialis]